MSFKYEPVVTAKEEPKCSTKAFLCLCGGKKPPSKLPCCASYCRWGWRGCQLRKSACWHHRSQAGSPRSAADHRGPPAERRRGGDIMAELANIPGPNYLPHYLRSVSRSESSVYQSMHHIVSSNLLPTQWVGKNVGLQTQLWTVFHMLWKHWPRFSYFSIWGYP